MKAKLFVLALAALNAAPAMAAAVDRGVHLMYPPGPSVWSWLAQMFGA